MKRFNDRRSSDNLFHGPVVRVLQLLEITDKVAALTLVEPRSSTVVAIGDDAFDLGRMGTGAD
ncbi:hypothetical protein O8B93_17285 [Agrobacterium rhizogenes]|uniref:hypothetical protein n=1 Tax=Rhizobium rhizogenes TaxID=359 RepID=UPI0022B74316|nr:hypothetical protein [Rhizobium rhizogenes]MCZ7449344.1 hypothetical protein [Rhizobium rhizogenes]